MIHHVIRMKVRDGVTPAQLEEALQALDEQGTRIPFVASFAAGRELGGEFDYCAIFAFEDLQAYQAYQAHPLHKRSERVGFPVMVEFAAFDVSDSDDPHLGAKIAEMQQANFAADPELVELMGDLDANTGAAARQD